MSEAVAEKVLRARGEHWRRHLVGWAEGMLGTPFKWGEVDCVHLARAALAVVTGEEIELPRYSTERGAVRAYARLAAEKGGVAGVLRSRGMAEHPALFARIGDVVVSEGIEGERVPSVLVCVGRELLGVHPGDVVKRYPLGFVRAEARVFRVAGA